MKSLLMLVISKRKCSMWLVVSNNEIKFEILLVNCNNAKYKVSFITTFLLKGSL